MVEKSEDYVFRKMRYSAQVEDYVTMEANPVTPEWNSANDMFILKGPSGGADWHYIESNKDGYYYALHFNVGTTKLEVEGLKEFMQENDINNLMVLYILEK